MRRHLSLVLATLFIVLGAFVLPVVYLLWMMQRPELIPLTVNPSTLYAMTIPGVVVELEKDHGIRDLDGTVLELDRSDLTRVLTGSFSEQDVLAKAEAVMGTIATTMDQAPPDTFQFYINIGTERPVVLDYLKGYFRHKLAARPECSMGSVMGVAWMGLQKVFGKRISEEEQLRRIPRCRGPRELQSAIMKAVSNKLDQGGGADSIRVRPNFTPETHRLVRRTLAIGRAGPSLFPILLVLLGGIFLLSWKHRRHCYARLAAPLLITSLILLVVFIPAFFFSGDLDLYGAVFKIKMVIISDSTSLWLQTLAYVVKVMLRRASYNLMLFGAVMLVLGLVLTRLHQRCEVPAN